MRSIILLCPMYVRQRVEMIEGIKREGEIDNIERLEEDSQMNLLIGTGSRKKKKEIRKIVLDYIHKAFNIRKRFIE